jgi:hypothetical protein
MAGDSQQRFQNPAGAVARGTLIDTPDGPRLVERLRPILARKMDRVSFEAADEAAKPIEIKRGAFGQDVPLRRLVVAPDQLIIMDAKGSAVVRADALLALPGVRRMAGRCQARYVQLFFAAPQVVMAEGVALRIGDDRKAADKTASRDKAQAAQVLRLVEATPATAPRDSHAKAPERV